EKRKAAKAVNELLKLQGENFSVWLIILLPDGYQLAWELDNAWEQSIKSGSKIDINLEVSDTLISNKMETHNFVDLNIRLLKIMVQLCGQVFYAIVLLAYLDESLILGKPESDLQRFLSKYRIPHPGRVGGRFFIQKMMPMMLSWVLGGNSSKLEGRPVCCRLSDKANDQLHTWFVEDDALERTING
ncbi:hypothetical protein S83_018400, partial [Arachis hypogaea]